MQPVPIRAPFITVALGETSRKILAGTVPLGLETRERTPSQSGRRPRSCSRAGWRHARPSHVSQSEEVYLAKSTRQVTLLRIGSINRLISPGSTWHSTKSWMLDSAPTVMLSPSARITLLNQAEERSALAVATYALEYRIPCSTTHTGGHLHHDSTSDLCTGRNPCGLGDGRRTLNLRATVS